MKSAISLLLLLTAAAQAADWPQWLGPQRNGISSETDLLQSWPADGPAVQWRTPLGNGFSGISIAEGRVFTMFAQSDDEFTICLDAETGVEIWRHRTGPYYKETQGGDGPRSTPTVDGEIVYVLGATGKLFALAAASGTPIWEKDLVAEFSSQVPRWGFSTSPLVEGDLLLVEAGGHDGNFVVDMAIDRTTPVTAVALDKATGATVWTALNEKMSYSSPIALLRPAPANSPISRPIRLPAYTGRRPRLLALPLENPLRRQRGDARFHRARPNFYLHRQRQRGTVCKSRATATASPSSRLAKQKDGKRVRHLGPLREPSLRLWRSILKC